MALFANKLYANSYDELKKTLKTIGKDKRIFVFFYGLKNRQGYSWYTKIYTLYIEFRKHFVFHRCPYCTEVEKPLADSIKALLPSNGVFIACSVGDRVR